MYSNHAKPTAVGSYQAQDTAGRCPEVSGEVSTYQNLLAELTAATAELLGKLQPILSEECLNEASAPKAQAYCELGGVLSDSNDRLRVLIRQLVRLRQRVEL